MKHLGSFGQQLFCAYQVLCIHVILPSVEMSSLMLRLTSWCTLDSSLTAVQKWLCQRCYRAMRLKLHRWERFNQDSLPGSSRSWRLFRWCIQGTGLVFYEHASNNVFQHVSFASWLYLIFLQEKKSFCSIVIRVIKLLSVYDDIICVINNFLLVERFAGMLCWANGSRAQKMELFVSG